MQLALEKREEETGALAPAEAAAITPMSVLQMAVQRGAGIDTIERLVKLQQDMAEFEAKMAEKQAKADFDTAMQRAQGKMRRIGVDANNPQTHSKYATFAKIDGLIRPIYTEEGFSLSFNTATPPTPDVVRLVCDVSHAGHTRTYTLDMPADGKGAKGGDVMTKTHATGAAITYGRRYLLNMIFNLAIGETDDDGNGAEPMADQMFVEYMEPIEAARDIASLQAAFSKAYKAAEKLGDKSAMAQFIKIKDKRKKELQ